MSILLFFLFGIAPSLIWLSFYLQKDAHPEPNGMVAKVFLLGAFATIPTIGVELAARYALYAVFPDTALTFAAYIFLCIALVEEAAKYLVVRWQVFNSRELDEPVDLIMYMIVAALGFAAAENMLMLSGLGPEGTLPSLLAVSGIRFLGATLLHGLVSGFFGAMLAFSFFDQKRRVLYTTLGFGGAVALHTAFNIAIIKGEGVFQILIPVLVLATLALFLNTAFRRVRLISALCK